MEADIEVEYKGKKYWVNSGYWNNDNWDSIVLRNEKGHQYNTELTSADLSFKAYEMALVSKAEVKLWTEPKPELEDTDMARWLEVYMPVLYKGKKRWVQKRAWADHVACTELYTKEAPDAWDGVFIKWQKLHDYFDLVPVHWKESEKTYYVRSDRWKNSGIVYHWVTLRNKNGKPYVKDSEGNPVKDIENSRAWFYANREDLKEVEN